MMIVQPARFSTTAPDPYFAQVKLLIQPKATDAGVIDYSPLANTINTAGSVPLGGASPWSGYQGASFTNNAANYLWTPDSSAFYFGTSDWTFDVVGQLTSIGAHAFFGTSNGPSVNLKVMFGHGSASRPGMLNLHYQNPAGTSWFDEVSWSPSTGVNFAVQAVCASGTITFAVNGTTIGSVSRGAALPDVSSFLAIGQDGEGGSPFYGSIAAVRLTAAARPIVNALTAGPFPTA